MLDAEFLVMNHGSSARARKAIMSLAENNHSKVRNIYSGKHEFLFMWGPGGQQQRALAAVHRAKGGTVIFFDLGYFHRSTHHNYIRMSINDPHPQKYLVLGTNKDRFAPYKNSLQSVANPLGPIIICGMGNKSEAQYGYSNLTWCRKVRDELNAKFPGLTIYYRPKPNTVELLEGTVDASGGDIEYHLYGAKLVVCHHSNVGVDCVLYGIPCVTTDGAAAAIWPSEITTKLKVPSIEDRLTFLEQLANFNYRVTELHNCLSFLETNINEIRRIGNETAPCVWQARA